jgi:hypothetical protein
MQKVSIFKVLKANFSHKKLNNNKSDIVRAFGHDLYLDTSLFDYILKSKNLVNLKK